MTSNAIRSTLLGACLLGVVAAAGMNATGRVEPSLVPRSWDLQFTYQTPRPIAIKDAEGQTHWFWYLSYRAQNNSGQERFFNPEITVATDRGDIRITGEKVPASVYEAIRVKLDNPLLENPISIVGKILLGEDHARHSVAIWPAFDHDVDVLNIFVAGMSGETATVNDPVTGEQVVLRKTLMIDFAFPGTEVHPQRQTIERTGQRWIMR
jgi:hypothetical protein